ncbi:hypothetical protein [Planctomicrobium piriforme]|uniref:Uncharacterized protein n=1 Tax=Planctomicrobium piriforme TaxID=1576369 RepID=A0A1I3EIM2_9PLAN|nr:hypothetical protein [Planctomicrobium piriforme]SFH98690.1 hypothetical protein SAMN05421753_104235 [Planctomicrobium piriforme]
MKTITLYEAADGSRFSTEEECRTYDKLDVSVFNAMAPLGEKPSITHGCWIQRDKTACQSAKSAMLVLIRQAYPNESVFKYPDADIHPMGYAGRFLSECRFKCFDAAWSRLCCINWDNYREYDQAYFAMNPEKAIAPHP